MAIVKGSVCFAFSTIFTQKKKFQAYDVYLNEKMFPTIKKNESIKMDKFLKHINNQKVKFSKDEVEDTMIKKAVIRSYQNMSKREFKKATKNEFIDIPIKENGLGQKGIALIAEFVHKKTLGAFLNADALSIASKIPGKSLRQIKIYQNMGKERLKILEKTIRDPKKVVEIAINQCFELYDIPKKNINSHRAGGYKHFTDTTNEFPELFIKYKELEDCKEMKNIAQKVPNKDKRYAFEVMWQMYDIEWDKWTQRLEKARDILLGKALVYAIPYVGGIVGSIISKELGKKSVKNLEEEVNSDFKLIFKELLHENLGIEWLKFNTSPLQKGYGAY